MSLSNATNEMKFDSRLIEFNLRTGQLTKEELQKHLASLPDCAGNSMKLEIEEGPSSSDSDTH